MNYKESKQILELVGGAKKILINCHRSPDPDSLASALALKKVLKEYFGKKVFVISPDSVSPNYSFIGDITDIEVIDDLGKHNFSNYDLWIILDSEKWSQIRLTKRPAKIKIINIDHHPESKKENAINIIDVTASSTTEMLYSIFDDWKLKVSKELAQLLLTGMVYDTHFFTNLNTSSKSHKIASELMDLGADNYALVLNLEHTLEINQMYLWREYLINLKVDDKYKFAWTSLPYSVYKKFPSKRSVTTTAAENIFRRIEGTNFAIVMCETTPNHLQVSLRSRIPTFDVSVIASALGGGGHVVAGGSSIEGMPYDKAVLKVLETARKYAKK